MWAFEHSVECKVDRNFAWQFWSNVSNWAEVDSSVEIAALDGPFQSRAKGLGLNARPVALSFLGRYGRPGISTRSVQ